METFGNILLTVLWGAIGIAVLFGAYCYSKLDKEGRGNA